MNSMRRISAIFIVVCMMLIAASIGAVLYLGFKIDAGTSAIVALAALTAMALFNCVSNRLRDRSDLGDQIGDLSRGTPILPARSPRFRAASMRSELKIASPVNRARAASDPLATEIGELGGLVKQIAETVARPCRCLQKQGALPARLADQCAERPSLLARPKALAALGENDLSARRALPRIVAREPRGLDFEGGDAKSSRPVPAAHRHFAAAKGAVLRGGVAPAHR